MTNPDDLPPLDSLSERISRAREESTPERLRKQAPEAGKSSAMRSGTELIAGVAVGGFLGYQLDEWLGTRPACVIAGIFLGMAGGVMNIYRAVSVEASHENGDEGENANHRHDKDET